MTNHYHEANRKGWDTVARAGRCQVDNCKNRRDCLL